VDPLRFDIGGFDTLIDRELESIDYVLYISTLEPRKNHAMLLRIWRRLLEKERQGKLVLVGKRGWNNEDTFRFLDQSETIRGSVIEIGQASDKILLALLRNATVSVFPSHCEGWGMPVSESLSVGTPVICSDIPALRENAGEAALFIPPSDEISWEKAVERVMTDTAFREALRVKSSKYTAPTWNEHFQQLENCLSTL
jgi:glycosyltransferase involved in cell wall biosynthesis